MGLFSRLFGSKNGAKSGPPVQEVEIHFEYGSTNFQYVYSLGDEIQTAIAEAKVGEYDQWNVNADAVYHEEVRVGEKDLSGRQVPARIDGAAR